MQVMNINIMGSVAAKAATAATVPTPLVQYTISIESPTGKHLHSFFNLYLYL